SVGSEAGTRPGDRPQPFHLADRRSIEEPLVLGGHALALHGHRADATGVRYGVTLPNFGPYADARVLASLAREAEGAGWDGFFLWDHVLLFPWPTVDPWIAMAAIALATERVRKIGRAA